MTLEPEKETSSRARNSLSPLALLSILASSLVIIGWFRSKSPINKAVEPIAPANRANAESNRARHEPSVIPDIPPSPSQDARSYRREDRTPRWKKVLEWTAVLTGIGLLAVNIGLWKATKKSANAANQAANAAKDSADLARKNAHFDQRAWLAISYGKLHFRVGQPFDFPVEIVDTGKTPAKWIQGEVVTLFLNRTERLHFNYDRGTSLEIGTMLPKEPHYAPSWLIATKLAPGEKIAALPISKQMVDAIRSGEAYVVVYGR